MATELKFKKRIYLMFKTRLVEICPTPPWRLYKVLRPFCNCLSKILTQSAGLCSSFTATTSTEAFRPVYLLSSPSDLGPFYFRSLHSLSSNSANTPSMSKKAFTALVDEHIGCSRTENNSLCLGSAHYLLMITHTSSKPINTCD